MSRRTALRLLSLMLALAGAARVSGAEPAAPAPASGPQAFSAQDYRGRKYTLDEFADRRLVVVAFLGVECPLAKLYAGRLQTLADEYAERGVAVIGVDSNSQDSPTEIDAFVRRQQLRYPLLVDAGCALADQFGATRTPEVFLLDERRTVRYRGRIDDQHQPGVSRDKVGQSELRAAIEDLLAGREVAVASTEAAGCLIGRPRPANEQADVTWSNQISRLFQDRCQECHRDGDIAPFALMDYHEAAGWGEMIAEVVRQKRMPPWHANPEFGHFSNDRTLTSAERDLILAWVDEGCPEGDPAQLPEPRTFTEGWQLPREPDQVFAMSETPFQVPADAGDRGVRYQHFVVDTNFTEDRWVNGIEVQPGNRAIVHHIIVYVVPPTDGVRHEIFLAAYVPGLRSRPVHENIAKRIPAGSKLKFQMHYTPNGTAQEDLSRVGFLFADPDAVTHEVITTEAANVRLALQPNQRNQEVRARSAKAARDVQVLSLSPHMHLRGQAFRFELERPDGSRETLLDVPHYDFNWQTSYLLAEPLTVPAGSRIVCRALFDNSEQNLANPDPSKKVYWGEQSWEEMMIGYFDIMTPRDATKLTAPAVTPSLRVAIIMDRLDKDNNGRLSREEVKERGLLFTFFSQIDTNGDGELDAEEFAEAIGAMDRGGF
ncbi:MAG: redoxin domain-containing protein [Planctomyces sp.]|nr:redoxin domain-containing protein [Planctomyces sp.]